MDFLSALKSGKRFKRNECEEWHAPPGKEILDSRIYSFHQSDLLAEDWIVEEPTVTITRSQLEEAYYRAGVDWILDHKGLLRHLAKRLGFSE